MQLLVCLAVLWPERGFLLFELSQNPFFAPILKVGLAFNPVLRYAVLPRRTPDEQRSASAASWQIRKAVPVALNLPVLVAQLPYVVLNPEKRQWVPKGMSFDVWRALSCPFAGMLLWWLAGRGIEALCSALQSMVRPRISWAETLFAGILAAVGIVALVGIVTSTPADRNDFAFVVLTGGALLWGALGTSTVAARLLQWRIAKRNIAMQSLRELSVPRLP
jgi:hypothetical protein